MKNLIIIIMFSSNLFPLMSSYRNNLQHQDFIGQELRKDFLNFNIYLREFVTIERKLLDNAFITLHQVTNIQKKRASKALLKQISQRNNILEKVIYTNVRIMPINVINRLLQLDIYETNMKLWKATCINLNDLNDLETAYYNLTVFNYRRKSLNSFITMHHNSEEL